MPVLDEAKTASNDAVAIRIRTLDESERIQSLGPERGLRDGLRRQHVGEGVVGGQNVLKDRESEWRVTGSSGGGGSGTDGTNVSVGMDLDMPDDDLLDWYDDVVPGPTEATEVSDQEALLEENARLRGLGSQAEANIQLLERTNQQLQ